MEGLTSVYCFSAAHTLYHERQAMLYNSTNQAEEMIITQFIIHLLEQQIVGKMLFTTIGE